MENDQIDFEAADEPGLVLGYSCLVMAYLMDTFSFVFFNFLKGFH